MPRRQQRIPITSGITRPIFQLSSDEWGQVERDYRYSIPEGVRRCIEIATADYLQLTKMERNAAPMSSARNEVFKIQRATATLLERIKDVHSCKSDMHSFVRHCISQKLKLPTKRPLDDHLANLLRDLENLASALSEIDIDGGYRLDAQQKGDAWRRWVRKLKAILEETNLRAGKSKVPENPLSRFIKALERKLPPNCRTSGQSVEDAVCEALQTS
jgi:hypothetical protein